MDKFFQEIAASFQRTFINDDRWMQFLRGLGVTIEITVVRYFFLLRLRFLLAISPPTPNIFLMNFEDLIFFFFVLASIAF